MGMRYTVLTYIFGNYEKVHEVREKDPDADYVLVTDDPQLKSDTWRIVCDQMLDSMTPIEKCYQVRFQPFGYADTDIVVRLDGSIGINQPLKPLIDEFESGSFDRCLMIHPTRNTFDKELECWVKQRKYPQEVADRCLTMMQAWIYDLNYKGLFQGCFEIVRNTGKNRDINRLTYQLMKYTGGEDVIDRLDQHIFSFVVNTLHRDLKVLPVSENLITMGSKWAQWYIHKSMRPISNPGKIQPMMFNQPCECWGEQPAADAPGTTATEPKSDGKPETQKSRNSKKRK